MLQVRLLRMGGLGGKAALLLAALAGGPGANSAGGPGADSAGSPGANSTAALRALLQPQDLASLVHIALLASHAQDLVRSWAPVSLRV